MLTARRRRGLQLARRPHPSLRVPLLSRVDEARVRVAACSSRRPYSDAPPSGQSLASCEPLQEAPCLYFE